MPAAALRRPASTSSPRKVSAIRPLPRTTAGYGFVDGWGASVGVHYPVLGGTAKLATNYRDMSNTKGYGFERWTVEAAYQQRRKAPSFRAGI